MMSQEKVKQEKKVKWKGKRGRRSQPKSKKGKKKESNRDRKSINRKWMRLIKWIKTYREK